MKHKDYNFCIFSIVDHFGSIEQCIFIILLYVLALKITFGSLYQDYIFIKPVEVVGVLATAILLQLVST